MTIVHADVRVGSGKQQPEIFGTELQISSNAAIHLTTMEKICLRIPAGLMFLCLFASFLCLKWTLRLVVFGSQVQATQLTAKQFLADGFRYQCQTPHALRRQLGISDVGSN